MILGLAGWAMMGRWEGQNKGDNSGLSTIVSGQVRKEVRGGLRKRVGGFKGECGRVRKEVFGQV